MIDDAQINLTEPRFTDCLSVRSEPARIPQRIVQEGLAVASIARDDPPLFPACTVTTMHFRHRQTDTDIVA